MGLGVDDSDPSPADNDVIDVRAPMVRNPPVVKDKYRVAIQVLSQSIGGTSLTGSTLRPNTGAARALSRPHEHNPKPAELIFCVLLATLTAPLVLPARAGAGVVLLNSSLVDTHQPGYRQPLGGGQVHRRDDRLDDEWREHGHLESSNGTSLAALPQ